MPNPPLISPVFQIAGNVLQYKPHVDYATWINLFDLSTIIAPAQSDATAALAAAALAKGEHRRVTLWHHESNATGGTLTLNINTLNIANHTAFSTAQGFNATQSFVSALMPACKFFFIGTTSNNSGIMAVYIDEVPIGTIDWYSSTTVVNVVKSLSFAANAITAGRHTLRLEVTTRNASNTTGYGLTLTKYWLAPDNDAA